MENFSSLSYVGSMDPAIEVMPDDLQPTNFEPETINENEKIQEESIQASLVNEFPLISEHRSVSEINLRLSKCELDNNGENLPPSRINEELLNPPTNLHGQFQLEAATESMEVSNSEDCNAAANTNTTIDEKETSTAEEIDVNTSKLSSELCYQWTEEVPLLLCSATEEYQPTNFCENFTKGCYWSPDGTCLLVPSEDFKIRVYELPRELYSGSVTPDIDLPTLKAALSVREGGIIYDSCWFPLMNSWDPSTCCFATTSRESPVHLWDAFNGELRATYRAYNQVDEVEAAISVQFVNSGAEIWCGFKNCLRTFDTDRPGRQTNNIQLKKDVPNVTGIVSCIRENPAMPGLVAFGSYSKSIGLYKDGPLCALRTASGVTQIEFSPCGMKLYSAVRRNNEMLCWDLRNPGTVLHSIKGRRADTNQRIQFSISPDGNSIVSGGTDGAVTVWRQDSHADCEEDLETIRELKISIDCVNGVSLHRCLPIMATTSGQRICEEEDRPRDNSVRFWWCGLTQQENDK